MKKTFMEVHDIEERGDALPSVSCIVFCESYPLIYDSIKRWSSPLWILDYSWTPSIPLRVGNARRPWRVREARTAHLYPPNTTFWEDMRNAKEGMAGMSMVFRGGRVAGLDKLIRKGQKYAKFFDSDGCLGQMLNHLVQIPEKHGENCFAAVHASMWDIFHMLLTARHAENEDYIIDDIPRVKKEESFSMRVENYMKAHYSEKLSLDSISDAVNVSPATLSSKFRQEQKVSPMARLNEIRVNIAKQRLLRGEKNCDIATQVGFCDEFHLSKTFKKVTGQSPKEFLKIIHQQEA